LVRLLPKTGIFLTLKEPTRQMIAEAASAGFVEVDMGTGKQRYPVIQILTISDILESYKMPRLPIIDPTAFKRAKREENKTQGDLGL
jgi:site-specific DNA-methyltransferase (adenine-specific)